KIVSSLKEPVKRIAFLLAILLAVYGFSASRFSVHAEDTSQEESDLSQDEEKRIEELTKTINDLQQKISQSKSEQQSLSSTIGVLDYQALLNEKEIEKT